MPIEKLPIFVVQDYHNRGWFELYLSEANAIARKDSLNQEYHCNRYVAYRSVVQDVVQDALAEQTRTLAMAPTLPKFYVPDNLLRDPDMITTEDLPNG